MSTATHPPAPAAAAAACHCCGATTDPQSQLACIGGCGGLVCPTCAVVQFPNRQHAGVCGRCRPAKAAFPCGRCGRPQLCDAFEFFCDMCAEPLCSSCLFTSFEEGQLKCAQCCDYPAARLLANSAARSVPHVITEAAMGAFPAVLVDVSAHPSAAASPSTAAPAAAPSKYEHLTDRGKLGEGAQGVVYKCRTAENDIVVSKEMIFDDHDRAVFESQLRQAIRMKELAHKHLIKYLDVYARFEPMRIFVIMPYYNEGDLKGFIERQREPVKEYRLCSLVLQIDEALEYLHTERPPLVHRDIKPENVLLLSNEEQVLLMDLDLVRSVDVGASVLKVKSQSPTYEYKAPELATSLGSIKADVFSLGVVMFVLATLPDFPFAESPAGPMVLSASDWTPESLEAAIRRDVRKVGHKMSKPYSYSEPFTQLLVDMLRHDPIRRPSSTEVSTRLRKIIEDKLLSGKE